jgi:hypothetical protein
VIPSFISQMSVVPLVFRDWWEDLNRPVSRLMDQHFGTGLHRDDLISGFTGLGLNRPSIFGNTYYRPWRHVARQNSSGSSTIQLDKDNFQVGTCSNFALSDRNRMLCNLIRSKVNICVISLCCFLFDFYGLELDLKRWSLEWKSFWSEFILSLRISQRNFRSMFVLYFVGIALHFLQDT